jgi:hypothetical protein
MISELINYSSLCMTVQKIILKLISGRKHYGKRKNNMKTFSHFMISIFYVFFLYELTRCFFLLTNEKPLQAQNIGENALQNTL